MGVRPGGMKIQGFELSSCGRGDPKTGEIRCWCSAELYTEPLWHYVVGQILYWVDLHKPRWFEPGNGRPSVKSHGDGTCTFLWRLRLELWMCYDFQHDKRYRKVVERVTFDDDAIWEKVTGRPLT
jgi:hypothetical protein